MRANVSTCARGAWISAVALMLASFLVLCNVPAAQCQDEEAWINPSDVDAARPQTPAPLSPGGTPKPQAAPRTAYSGPSGSLEMYPAANSTTIDWLAGRITAQGSGQAPANALDKARGTALAVRTAVMEARKELYLAARSLRLDGDRTVAELFDSHSDMEFQVSSFIRNSKILDKTENPDGTVVVRSAVDLWPGLVALLAPKDVSFQSAVYNAQGAEGFTGLVVDARSVDAHPGILPSILDPNGVEIYGPSSVSRQNGLDKGLAAYVSQASEARSRVGANPLAVTAMTVSGKTGVNIHLGPADTARVRSLGGAGNVLQNCQVAIVLKPESLALDEARAEDPALSREEDGWTGPVLIPESQIVRKQELGQ